GLIIGQFSAVARVYAILAFSVTMFRSTCRFILQGGFYATKATKIHFRHLGGGDGGEHSSHWAVRCAAQRLGAANDGALGRHWGHHHGLHDLTRPANTP